MFVFVNGVPQQTDEFANEVSVYFVNWYEKQINASVCSGTFRTNNFTIISGVFMTVL